MKSVMMKKSVIDLKKNLEIFRQQFLLIDIRMRKNLVIVAVLLFLVLSTGVVVIISKAVEAGNRFIDSRLADDPAVTLQTKI